MVELERKALMGDREAQRLCTEQGIVLPCPRCGETPVEKAFIGARKFYFECNCGSATFCYDRKEKKRCLSGTPAPPRQLEDVGSVNTGQTGARVEGRKTAGTRRK